MRDPNGRVVPALGVALGLAGLAIWLVVWRLVSDAADRFAPVNAAGGFALWLLASHPLPWRFAHPRFIRLALRTAGLGAIGLAVAASLSLGAFLPPGLAAWVSPPLGRFGGPLALSRLAVGLALAWVSGVLPRRRAVLLDVIACCALASVWIGSQLGRQASFPPPPMGAVTLAPRLTTLLWVCLALAAGAALLWRAEGGGARGAGRGAEGAGGGLYARWLWRWAGLLAILGLAISLASGAAWWWFAALLVALLVGGLLVRPPLAPRPAPFARGAGWLVGLLLALALVYFTTAEDLETVFLRNTVERRAQEIWRGWTPVGRGDDLFGARRGVGELAGTVRDEAGRPLAGASVVVADREGRVYDARSGPDGRYRLAGLPAGSWLPLAVAPGRAQAPPDGTGGRSRVATVRPGRSAAGIDFRLDPAPPPGAGPGDDPGGGLRSGESREITIDSLEPSTVLRREFVFARDGKVLDGGLVHEPLPAAGSGPFPILLIVYPGEAKDWEGVSAPLTAQGYVVVSYFPRRLLDLDGDLDDLRLLLRLTEEGRLSARGDPGRVVLVGGSVSTVYTYLLAQAIAGTPANAPVRAAIQYGGLFDFFAFRRSWEAGRVVIDPGISELEYLLVAFGRPDTRPELYLRLSPRWGIDGGSLPPTLLVHADRDIIVPVDQSIIAADVLAALGIDHRLLRYPELEHYLDVSKRDPAQVDMLEQTVAFLRRRTGP